MYFKFLLILNFVDGDILQNSGKVGNGIMTDTYIMTMSENFNNVRGTVERGKKIKNVNIQQCTGNS
jgi:mannose/fructose/N-acetylgalactosamine-specific phosphotransferase system component IIB